MAENIYKPVGATKASKPDAGGANLRTVPVFGVVKNNIDPNRAGRIQVYISDFGSNDPDDAKSWSTVSYMSPFFGSVQPTAPATGSGSYVGNPSSYGFWNSPPDIGSIVICVFIGGDPNYGFYIGCVPKAESLHMVPAIGSSSSVIINNTAESIGYGGATKLPVTNINTNNPAIANGPGFLKASKPVHSYSAAIMNQQGLIRDPVRGPISSSAQRESPSRVGWGVSTPGRPIYSGGFTDDTIVKAATNNSTPPESLRVVSRRGGHSIVMDDGDIIGQDQLIRLRSAGGHQILMSDDGQTLFIIHSNGQSWIEMGKEGTIDLFATNSVNIRTQGELNFHADQDININTKKKLNIQAESINLNSDKETTHKVGTNYQVQTVGNYTHKIDGSVSTVASGTADFKSTGIMNLLGRNINLNSGGPAITPPAVTPKSLIAQSDTLFSPSTGFSEAPGALQTIASRAPAHAPWANANQGVNVKTTTNASAVLPAPPTPAVAATNTTSASTPPTKPVTTPVVSSVPPTPAVSAAINQPVTGSLLGAAATNAAAGPLASAVATGAGIVPTASGLVAAVGVFAQTPEQLEASGICKPGSSALITSLVQGGANITSAFSSSVFTSPGGINSFLQSIPNQISAQISNFQQAQTALTNASVITGAENASSIAGLIMSAASEGITTTINTVKTMASELTPTISGIVGEVDAVTNSINSGNFAANLSETTASGIEFIKTASGIVNAETGPVGAVFDSIKSSFEKLEVGIPQNLTSIANNIKTPDITSITKQLESTAESMGALIKNSSAATLNNISLQQSIESAASTASEFISTNSEKISSTIASLAAVAPAALKAPIIGENSNDRTEITSQLDLLLGDIKIPKPNFGLGPSEMAKSKLEISQNIQEIVIKAKEAVLVGQTQIDAAKKKFYDISNTLVQGSPEIEKAKTAWFKLVNEQAAILNTLDRSLRE